VRTIMQKLRSFFPICRACTVSEQVARTESLMDAVLVGQSAHTQQASDSEKHSRIHISWLQVLKLPTSEG